VEIVTESINFKTKGKTHIIDITNEVQGVLSHTGFREGSLTVFAIGSTAGITTVEYEPGLVKTDLPKMFEKLAPYGEPYAHHNTWGDDNGSSHLKASLLGCSLVVPFTDGKLILGTWQQIIFIDFDTRPRSRKIVVQITGKK
jgi:secondary thiamine-phosphate synthase enzyme